MNLYQRAVHDRSRPFRLFTIAITAILGFVGCTATYMAGYTDSPDGKYRFYGSVRGSYGRSFDEQTTKVIRIRIVSIGGSEIDLFKEKFKVTGSDVCWDAKWDSKDNLVLSIYDFGPGIDRYDAVQKGSPTNHIRTVIYHFNSKAGIFSKEASK